MMRALALGLLLLSCEAGAATYYVSTEATNGYVVGNDSNAGTAKGTAKLSLCCAAGSAIGTASAGDTIYVNGASVEASTNSTRAEVSKALTILPEPGTTVELYDTNATSVLYVSHDTTATTTIGAFVVNAGTNSNDYAVERANPTCASNQPTLVLNGTIMRGGDVGLLLDSARCGTTTLEGITATSSSATYGLRWTTSLGETAAKTISATDSAVEITGATNGANYGLDIQRYAAGASQAVTVTLDGNSVAVTAPAALGASAAVRAINLVGIASPTVTDNTITATAYSTTTDSYGIAALATSLNARGDSPYIANNAVSFVSPVGYGIAAGDTTNLSYVDSARIIGNSVTGAYYANSTPHCMAIGRVTGGLLNRNITRSCYVGILAGITQGASIAGNIVQGAYGPGLFAKGSGATTAPEFANNTVVIDEDVAGGPQRAYGGIGVAAQGATANAATNFRNNVIYAIDPPYAFVTVDTSQAASFDRNYYHGLTAQSAAYLWRYTSNDYTAIADWNGNGAVVTDYSADPAFLGGSSPTTAEGFKLRSNSPLIRAGTCYLATGCAARDFGGRRARVPPDIGAWQRRAGD